jgi:hypothetical protein
MSIEAVSSPLRLVTRLVAANGRLNGALFAGITIVAALQVVAVLMAAHIDNTWWLQDGLGVLQHYGAWGIVLSDPLVLICAALAYHQFGQTFAMLPVKNDSRARSRIHELVDRYTQWIEAKDLAVFPYVLCVSLGFLCWLNNIRQTETPSIYFAHDVFDAPPHMAGFIVYKACLFVSWVIVYPVAGYVVVCLSFSTAVILATIRNEALLDLRVTHPDNRYGLRGIGLLTLRIVLPYLIAYSAMWLLFFTHGHWYPSILYTALGMTFLTVLTSYSNFAPTLALFREAKARTYASLLERSYGTSRGDDPTFAVERMSYSGADGSPYSGLASIALVGLNLAQVAGLLVSFR